MNIRLCSGSLKRRSLRFHGRAGTFRPTQQIVREALVDILGGRIHNAVAADLCAGSGAVGFELLSGGAAHCDFVESDRARVSALARHAEIMGVAPRCRIFRADIRRFFRKSRARYDIAFFDPPYDRSDLYRLVEMIGGFLSENGILIVERKSNDTGIHVSDRYTVESRRYGGTAVDFISRTM